jgi:putative sterol carrier protein
MHITELFESMPGRLNPEAAAGMNKTLQWNITGEDAGVWAMQINNGEGVLIPGGVENPDVTFTISAKHWLSIAEGKLDGMKAFMTGKLKVAGDMTLGMKMSQLFPTQNQ